MNTHEHEVEAAAVIGNDSSSGLESWIFAVFAGRDV
jgi:hypothetical protein